MNFDEIKRVFPKCPLKSAFQLWEETNDVSHLMDGYGLRGKGNVIELLKQGYSWDCIFTFDLHPVNICTICDSLKIDGLLIATNFAEAECPNMVCIYSEDFKVYKKIK